MDVPAVRERDPSIRGPRWSDTGRKDDEARAVGVHDEESHVRNSTRNAANANPSAPRDPHPVWGPGRETNRVGQRRDSGAVGVHGVDGEATSGPIIGESEL